MANIEEQIAAVELEIKTTEYNKATQGHIGRLKAKLARLRELQEVRRGVGGASGRHYAVKKSGHATAALVGLPNVGKSSLLNSLTGTESEVANFAFTTLDVIPGLLEYNGAEIQILDLPGIIGGAARGRGRGREVLSVVRSADLVILVGDASAFNLDVIRDEVNTAGLRLNVRPPDVVVTKKDRGGVTVRTTLTLTKIDEKLIKGMLTEMGHLNADIVIREDVDEGRLIDGVIGTRVYVPAIVAVNKVDLVDDATRRAIRQRMAGWKLVETAASRGRSGRGIEELKRAIFDSLRFIRIYMRPKGGEPDLKDPLMLREGDTVESACRTVHRDWVRKFRYALIWGPSARFPGQTVGIDHPLKDGDILTVITQR